LAYKALPGGLVEVYDLDFAAFCLLKELAIADMIKEGGHRGPPRFRFVFKTEDAAVDKCAVEYINSDCARFADCVRRLKKTTRQTGTRER